CGAISKADSSTGNVAFGTSGGTDCTTPGSGGAGNTHAARTGYYHLTNINRKAASFLPANTWLNGTLTSNMNINNTCNAFWNGSTVNLYRSGGGCSNTGELAAVFLHEWGHGMDTNAGGAASDKGTGEAVGDTFAFLETKDSCIGHNFQPGVPCYNCGTCTGVRDVAAFAQGGPKTIARPSTVADNNGINCDRYSCPYYQFFFIGAYQGPMGYQGHCESYIASSANWDLAQSLVAYHGSTAGWAAMDQIWYESLTASKSAYQVASGGKCNPAATVNGCGATNWYTVYLAVDDDDGNLANGTPNGCRIWDAFNAHGIACGSRPACTL
ncbi:MAG TPA: endopeptidase, partial [Thermoanaerobaculia bacterium]|nr:endopeptidase [Thermoanaerobaculia bacterium]